MVTFVTLGSLALDKLTTIVALDEVHSRCIHKLAIVGMQFLGKKDRHWSLRFDKSFTTAKQRGLSLLWASARAVHHC